MNNKIFKLKGERLNTIYRNLQSSSFSPRRAEKLKKKHQQLEKNL